MISNPIPILDQRDQLGSTGQLRIGNQREVLNRGRSGGVDVSGGLVELINDGSGELAAFAALAGNAELIADICHATGTTTTQVADLVISDLTTNTNVHGAFPRVTRI